MSYDELSLGLPDHLPNGRFRKNHKTNVGKKYKLSAKVRKAKQLRCKALRNTADTAASNRRRAKKVVVIKNGQLITVFTTAQKAAEWLNCTANVIYLHIGGRTKNPLIKGYFVAYECATDTWLPKLSR